MTITTLADNNLPEPMVSEHGLSILIEWNGKRILFDTGESDALSTNAELLGISLDNLDYLIISHGHYDHGGNIAKILAINPHIIVVAHPNCTVPRYSHHENKPIRSIGLTQENRAALIGKHHSKQIWCRKPVELIPGLWVSGEIPRITDFETTGGPFYLDQTKTRPDLIPDDLAIWFDHGDSLTVITGCCHSGVVNTITYIESITQKPVTELIGGLHLVNADQNRLDKTVAFLNDSSLKKIVPMHCTGESAFDLLKERCAANVIHRAVE